MEKTFQTANKCLFANASTQFLALTDATQVNTEVLRKRGSSHPDASGKLAHQGNKFAIYRFEIKATSSLLTLRRAINWTFGSPSFPKICEKSL